MQETLDGRKRESLDSGVAPPGLSLSRVWMILGITLPALVLLVIRMPTPDIAYIIRVGDRMLRTHALVRTDILSFTAHGKPWVNQQWGAEVLFAAVYRLGGWPLISLARCLSAGLAFSLVLQACRARGATMRQASWLTLAFSPVALGGLQARPQMFGMVLFATVVWITATRDDHPSRLAAVPLVTLVWANLHGTFFLAPLVTGLAALDDFRRRSPLAKRTMAITALSILATVVNPFGLRVWDYVFGVSSNTVITRVIVEWQPPTIHDLIGAIFFASILGAAVIAVRSERRLSWTSLLTMAIFIVIGLYAVRGIFWWGLIAPPLLADVLRPSRDANAPHGDRLANVLLVALIGGLVILLLPWWRLAGGASAQEALLVRTPSPALARELQRVVRPGEGYFDPLPWASWLELTVPTRPVFVDSRIELYPTAVWRDYFDVTQAREGWERVLQRWHIRVVVAEREEQRELIPRLLHDPHWSVAYSDAGGMIFVRS
jgi:hypothetical protein